jgi:hypothetical protein
VPIREGDVCQQMCWDVQTFAFSACDGLPEVFGVPVDYDGCEQIDTSVAALCKELGISPVTLYRYVYPK